MQFVMFELTVFKVTGNKKTLIDNEAKHLMHTR